MIRNRPRVSAILAAALIAAHVGAIEPPPRYRESTPDGPLPLPKASVDSLSKAELKRQRKMAKRKAHENRFK